MSSGDLEALGAVEEQPRLGGAGSPGSTQCGLGAKGQVQFLGPEIQGLGPHLLLSLCYKGQKEQCNPHPHPQASSRGFEGRKVFCT